MTGRTGSNKAFERRATATLSTGSAALVGVVSGDTVTLGTGSAAGTFASAAVGPAATVTVSGLTISGADDDRAHREQQGVRAEGHGDAEHGQCGARGRGEWRHRDVGHG